jgi:hypothetical protein
MLESDAVSNPMHSCKASTVSRLLVIVGIVSIVLVGGSAAHFLFNRQPAGTQSVEIVAPQTGKPAGTISPTLARDSAHPLPVVIPIASLSSLMLPEEDAKKSDGAQTNSAAEPVRLLGSVSSVRDEEKPTVNVPLGMVPRIRRFEDSNARNDIIENNMNKSIDSSESKRK